MRWRLAAGCSAACVLTVASAARADADVDFQLSAGAGVSWIRSMPALTSTNVTSTLARNVAEGKIPIGGSLTAVGAGFDMGVSVDDRWIFPLLGFAGYGAVGTYDTVITSLDGSIARVRPWSAYAIDVLLPGVGYRVKKRRYLFSASLRTGITGVGASGSIAGGGESTPMSLSAISGLVQAEIEACRRLDPIVRVCLQVAPRIYDFGFMNGVTFGLRAEWGR